MQVKEMHSRALQLGTLGESQEADEIEASVKAFTEEVLRPGPGANAHAFLVYRFTAYTLRLLLNFNFRNIHFEKRQVVHRNSQEQEWEMIFKCIFRL